MAGFCLIETLGLRRTTSQAAAVSFLTGLAAWLLSRGAPDSAQAALSGAPAFATRRDSARLTAFAAAGVAAVSGLTALGYEVVWTRAAQFFLGSTVYAFSIILIVVLLGLALGAHVMGWLADRVARPGMLLGGTQCAVGVLGLLSMPVMVALFRAIGRDSAMYGAGMGHGFLAVGAGLLAPAALLGGTFSIASKWCRDGLGGAGRAVGIVAGANSAGATLGPIVAGFVLMPWLGMHRCVMVLAGLNLLVGATLLLVSLARGHRLAWVTLAATAAALAATSPWWRHDAFRRYAAERALGRVVAFEEGVDSTVTISDHGDERLLSIDGTPMASSCPGMRLRAHLPMMLHPNPHEVLVVGFGTGTTAGTVAARYPQTHVDCVELSGTVVRGAHYFKPGNHDVIHNPRVQVIVEDTRSYVECSDKSYDVIIVDAPHPFAAHASALFSAEFYVHCWSRLADGGVLLQWIPLYLQPAEELKTMVRTFVTVFPDSTLWSGDDINLIAVRGQLRVSLARLDSLLKRQGVIEDLRPKTFGDARSFLSKMYLMDAFAARCWVGDGLLVTDDLPCIEFSIPRYFHKRCPRAQPVEWGEIAQHWTLGLRHIVD